MYLEAKINTLEEIMVTTTPKLNLILSKTKEKQNLNLDLLKNSISIINLVPPFKIIIQDNKNKIIEPLKSIGKRRDFSTLFNPNGTRTGPSNNNKQS